MAVTNGQISFWWQQIGLPQQRASLPGSIEADVAIVGAGFTGLWAAYYLKKAQPDARVVVLEQRFAGYGASGRNGGWCVNSITGGRERYLHSHGTDAVVAFQQAMNDTVDEVVRVAAAESIEADIRKGGEFNVAYTPAQAARMRAFHEAEAHWPGADVHLLTAPEAAARINVANALGATWQPHCARVNPAKLASGLAAVVEALGVQIYEGTTVTQISSGQVQTDFGVVRAPAIIRATEGFTANIRGEHRTWLPMNSSMIVTEPLPPQTWAQIGWGGAETLGDYAHVYMYAQRTADDRIAFGGRGVPYRYGSRVDADGLTQQRTIESLTDLLRRFFPAAAGAEIDHAWSGVLGVPRDWAATIGFDPSTGLGWAGGYVGTGVATTNLAGRTLADLVLRRDTELTRLPWVGRKVRKWEPEPLRWLGVQAIYAAYRAADRQEAAGRATTAPVARIADLISGH
ncbi:MAG: FAD-binding oxidoreductase [Propionicimonas sp.]|uniref:NAD(P)/FAD-dependent oxidoreductase n=1 Tax=Propionicimonas sp. TaxID=1955623 RepID=UPI001D95C9D2|nr:FAD-dependent oxidoreductase [Propionicimonas sp.]MBU4188789.1 FAD-binding oxidoreductase [Actinomycetota bacterium]MBU4206126.1 FAD-binding oxidoreductase [Actinomycetota bacterium]MBU4249214.1 FAD-binding oxidoreductase [Actinomycetota bacterium]MBU4410765.1 FAD-binding oxidoreductase [Actinomycetota bacterium]MBU4418188.1 FAD-binding oxidoreductase [Actinomycetota bacterium]